MTKLARLCLLATITLEFALSADQVAAAEQNGGKHFLWRVTNASQPFYVLGSVHALRSSDYPLGQSVDAAVKQCRRFVFEVANDPRGAKMMTSLGYYPPGVTLKLKVRPETYAFVQKIAKVRASAYERKKPWFIAMTMLHHQYNVGVSYNYGVESYVRSHAPGGSQFGGLESSEEHIRVLSDMSDIESEVFLLQALVHMDGDAAMRNQTVAAYKRGDTNAIYSMFGPRDSEAPYIADRLINRRNAAWIPRIEREIHSGKPTMVVVGARHLCGPRNVVSMLQARGYKLEQL